MKPPDPELAVCTEGVIRLAASCNARLCRATPVGVPDLTDPVGVPVLELTGERERPSIVTPLSTSTAASVIGTCLRGGVDSPRVVEAVLGGGDRLLAKNPSPDVSVDCRPGLHVTDTTCSGLDTIETGLGLDATDMTPNPGIAIWTSPE